ncbi:MAG: hypothetical protein Q8R12_01665 [bacterium]|nr:hypothetical protein [bacterium]
MEDSRVRVLLVPFPITPLASFAYFAYRHFGILSADVEVRYSAGGDSQHHFAGGKIRRLDHQDLHKELETFIWRCGDKKRGLLKRILDYCAYSPEKKLRYRLLQSYSSMSNPRPFLESAIPFFEECLRSGRDLWQVGWNEEEDGKFFPKSVSAPEKIPPGSKFGTFPVLKSKNPAEREVIKTASYELKEGRVMFLKGEHLGCAVIGPKSSGKSTFAFSLAVRMNHILESLKSRGDLWADFSLEATLLNLDLGTPTDEGAIGLGLAKDREMMQKLKRPWTMELALEALAKFSKAKARPGLVIVDLPGKVSRFSELAASLADVAVIVVNNWEEEVPRWRAFADSLGIEIVGEVRSRLWKEGSFSLITRYRPGEFVSGRVAGMDRVDFSGDACVSQMAEFLLLDIFPGMVELRRKKIGRLIYES